MERKFVTFSGKLHPMLNASLLPQHMRGQLLAPYRHSITFPDTGDISLMDTRPYETWKYEF